MNCEIFSKDCQHLRYLRTGIYNPHLDGGHRDINVYEDFDLVVYLEEIEPDDN